MPITKDQARDLAKTFRNFSKLLGDYRFTNWGQLTVNQRRAIEDAEWTLLNYSSDFITTAVGIVLDEIEGDIKAIVAATAKAQKVITNIETVGDVIKVMTALVALGGAIASQNPSAIASAVADVFKTSKTVIDKHKAANN